MHYRIRQVLKKVLLSTRIINVFWKFIPNGVYVFNYHRIGDAERTKFDRAVFSCTAEALNEHVKEIKKNFTIISSKQLREIIDKNQNINKRYAMLTFDDGYYDNYSEAFPILKQQNVPATFYLPTNFINSNRVPWWDEIAYLLRNSLNEYYQLPGQSTKFHLNEAMIDSTIQKIVFQAKRIKNQTVIEVLSDIRKKFPKAVEQLNNEKSSLFMNWEQAKEMSLNGMEIGSHTMSHQILAQLTDKEQEVEIKESKQVIEKNIGTEVHSIAYPVGRYHCYTEKSCQLSEQAGYIIGFNNEPGQNRIIKDAFDINRTCVDVDDINLLKFNSCF